MKEDLNDIEEINKLKFYKLSKSYNINMFPVIFNRSLDELFSFHLGGHMNKTLLFLENEN